MLRNCVPILWRSWCRRVQRWASMARRVTSLKPRSGSSNALRKEALADCSDNLGSQSSTEAFLPRYVSKVLIVGADDLGDLHSSGANSGIRCNSRMHGNDKGDACASDVLHGSGALLFSCLS